MPIEKKKGLAAVAKAAGVAPANKPGAKFEKPKFGGGAKYAKPFEGKPHFEGKPKPAFGDHKFAHPTLPLVLTARVTLAFWVPTEDVEKARLEGRKFARVASLTVLVSVVDLDGCVIAV